VWSLLEPCLDPPCSQLALSACTQVPYITTVRTGLPSTIPALRRFHHNFVLANYNSQEAVDTDDGSSYLLVQSNVLAHSSHSARISHCDVQTSH
jgi:hypothetical protein